MRTNLVIQATSRSPTSQENVIIWSSLDNFIDLLPNQMNAHPGTFFNRNWPIHIEIQFNFFNTADHKRQKKSVKYTKYKG